MMRFPDRFHLGLIALALGNMIPTVLADDAWVILGIAGTCTIGSCLAWRPNGRSYVPRWTVHVLVLASLGYLCYEMFAYKIFTPDAEPTVYILDLAHFIMLLSACKFFDLRTNRDHAIIGIMALLLLIIGAFVSGSVIFGMVLLLDVTLGAAWVTAMQAKADMDSIEARRREAMPLPVAEGTLTKQNPGTEFFSGRRRGRLRTVFTTAVALVVISIVTFVTVPRGLGEGLLGGVHGFIQVSTTGFTDNIRLDETDIAINENPVMRVRFLHNGEPIVDPDFEPYMRGTTFDVYQRGRWRRTHGFAGSVIPRVGSKDQPELLANFDYVPESSDTIRQEVWLQGIGDGFLFSMYPPLTLGAQEIKRVHPDFTDSTLRTPERLAGEVQYTIDTALQANPELTSALRIWQSGWPRFVRPPEVTPRIRSFAHQLAAQYGDPTDPGQHQQIAQGFENHLRSNLFRYTLSRGPTTAEMDPLEDFLFVNRRGHCEYFASAMTLMCQITGLSARLVNGYMGGVANQAGGFFQFRARDAHAWVEVYLPDKGWTTFDPTPMMESRRRTRQGGLLAGTQQWFDYLQFNWSAFIISFDSHTRLGLADRAAQWLSGMLSAFDEDGEAASIQDRIKTLFWGPGIFALWQRILYWLMLALVAAFLILAIRVVWILSLMLRERFANGHHQGRPIVRRHDAKFYDRLLLLLANKGHLKSNHLTPAEFADDLARSNRDLYDMREYTDWFYEVQYGQRALGHERRKALWAFMQHLREDSSFGTKSPG